MTFKTIAAGLAAACALGATSAQAAVLYSNYGPDQSYDEYSSMLLGQYTWSNDTQYQLAVAFTPVVDGDVTEISLAVGAFFGDPAMEVALWTKDFSTKLGAWAFTGMSAWYPGTPPTVTGITGVHLTAGVDYAITARSVAKNDWATWFWNSTPQRGCAQFDYGSDYSCGGMMGAFEITGDTTVVPEPTAWALMILGFGGVGAVLRQRRRLAFA